MCEIFSNVFQAKMHLMSECWRHAWSSRLPKNPKIHLFKQNLWIQVKKMDFWISQGFFFFFLIFLDSSKGCLDFWVSKSKIQKNSRKKKDFCKNPTFTCIFLDFLEKSIFFLEFFWFLISGLEKSIFFLGFFGFLQKSIFFLGFVTFFENSIFFLEFFWIFDLGNPKIQTPFRRIQKNQKKYLGKSKNPSFWPESKDSVWKDGFLDFWIFGWTILRNPRLHRLDLNPSIQVERWIVVFLFPFFGRISALKKKINQEWLQLSFDLREQASCILYVFFHGFFIISYCIDMYIYACPP